MAEQSEQMTEQTNKASQLASELLKPIKHNYPRRKVMVNYPSETFSADLRVMPVEKRYRYILTIIDCFARYAWAIPLKNKTAKGIVEAFKPIFSTRKPDKLWVDKGSEFYNKTFLSYLKELNIHIYSQSLNLRL